MVSVVGAVLGDRSLPATAEGYRQHVAMAAEAAMNTTRRRCGDTARPRPSFGVGVPMSVVLVKEFSKVCAARRCVTSEREAGRLSQGDASEASSTLPPLWAAGHASRTTMTCRKFRKASSAVLHKVRRRAPAGRARAQRTRCPDRVRRHAHGHERTVQPFQGHAKEFGAAVLERAAHVVARIDATVSRSSALPSPLGRRRHSAPRIPAGPQHSPLAMDKACAAHPSDCTRPISCMRIAGGRSIADRLGRCRRADRQRTISASEAPTSRVVPVSSNKQQLRLTR